MKKLLSFAIIGLTFIFFSVTAQARGAWCHSCNNGELHLVQTNAARIWQEEQKCRHGHPHGTDLVQFTEFVDNYRCSNCGDMTSRVYTKTTKVDCHGYNY